MKETIGNTSIPDKDRPFTAILFVDPRGGCFNFGSLKHKTVRLKYKCGDLVIFSGDVFYGGNRNKSSKNNIRILLFQFNNKKVYYQI